MMYRLPLLALLLTALASGVSAQEASETRRVVLTDGSVYVGTIADENADPLVITTSGGIEQRIPRDRVREITGLIAGKFTRLDPSRSRLFLSPTGRMLGRGNKRFSAYYIFPSMAYGVGDRLDVSLGSTIPAVSSDGAALALNANIKGQLIASENGGFAVGTSALIPIATEGGIPGIFGTVYAVGTVGNETTGVTVGVTGAYVTDLQNSEIGNGAAIVLGIDHQLSNNFKVISESFVFVNEFDNVGLFSIGGRAFGDQLAGDFAVGLVYADGEFLSIPVPFLGVSYNF